MANIEVRTPNLNSVRVGKLQAKYSADGTRILRYFVDFWHNDLDLHKELSAPEIYILQSKVDALMAVWDKRYADHRRKLKVSNGKESADQLTMEASEKLEALKRILSSGIGRRSIKIDWDALKTHERYSGPKRFSEPKPNFTLPTEPRYFDPSLTFWDTLFGRKSKKISDARIAFDETHLSWQKSLLQAEQQKASSEQEWQRRKKKFEAEAEAAEKSFLVEQAEHNARVDLLRKGVERGETQSVVEHATMVLDRSDYEDLFEKSFEIDYLPDERSLLIEYELPSPDHMPVLKTAKFVASTGEIKETQISERERKSNFDSACFQICLRTIYEVLKADEHHYIDKVLFNGFATYIDRSTGRDMTSCIMSILVNRIDFEAIDLSRIDPKACFKNLKGVSASTLSALAPIPPVMEMNKEDRRFIEGRNTVDNIDNATNLAAMDWNDFEHLVRELFEKEFAARGGEVRVTQSSSDGGVDAVAFDPDPITGGKIVIQAKRYTRTVGVAAVRDLYGTMQHEGASRGVLITTADYGPDAHKFASGKPITLFTGANMLHLLQKHGYNAKIDLREARKELNLRERA